MTRCVPRPAAASAGALAVAAVLLFGAAAPLTSSAQIQRPFPATALRGELRFGQAPEVTLNGQPARLAPGARIRGTDNLLQLSGSLAGQTHVVHYTVDPYGLLLDVWLLTPAERARQPWPRSAAEAAAWRFDAAAQTWSRP
jgi:hypothetical protein